LITVCHGDRCLPRQLIERAEKEENPSPWTALDVMIAAAIELLLTCPMRIGNVARLDIDRHFTWRGT
jgi:hypothetical protein